MSVIDPCHLPVDAGPLSVSMTEAEADTFVTEAAARTSTAYKATVAVVGKVATVTFANNAAPAGVVRVDWGDGAVTTQAISAATAAHTYLADGVYQIGVSAVPTWVATPFARAPVNQTLALEAAVGWPAAFVSAPLALAAFVAAHKPT